jgi:hypothetical protein
MRLQEFYESPHATIRNQHFTWEDFLDAYTHKGKMTYCSDYFGFNVPGNIIVKFFDLFKNELTKKEIALYDTLKSLIEKHGENFYLIGVYREQDIQHEQAHGMFYLSPEYRKEVIHLIQQFSPRYFQRLCEGLAKKDYCKEVFLDEIQAYAIDEKRRKFVELFRKYRHPKT